jgi:hypothetical protein
MQENYFVRIYRWDIDPLDGLSPGGVIVPGIKMRETHRDS